jgi:polygalacturonase
MEEDGIRPGLLLFLDCQNVLIEGVTFTFSPFWTVHPTWCENVWIRNITVRNPYLYAPNTDGVNLEGCRRALVEGVYADTGDDAICIKSGRDEDGRLVGRPCEQVLIRRCRANRCHGGITIGSETSGGVRDIRVEDCELMNARFGLWIKTAPERGNVIENIEVRRLKAHCIEYIALCMTMGYYTDGNEPADVPKMPTVRHILVEDVSCESAPLGVEINGYPEHPIQDVTLRHLFLCAEQGMRVNHATALTMEDVHFRNE